jgi:ketosteroid isomerase-like protein
VDQTRRIQLTQEEIRNLAEEWISAWNAHDLDAIMSHYDEAVELTSPVAAQLLEIPGGKVSGKANVSSYFKRGLEAYPGLYFDLQDVLAGLNTADGIEAGHLAK